MTRRRALAALAPVVGAGVASRLTAGVPATAAEPSGPAGHGAGHGHAGFRDAGRVNHRRNGFTPAELLREFDWGRTRRLPGGRVLREFELEASEKTLEVAPGVEYAAWAYNGRVPGPTLRAREGERVRVRFRNVSAHPHTIHFHGLHASRHDGIPGLGAGAIAPGQGTVYEFEALPAGLHLYHCHVSPLAPHIAKGLYGAFIIDPREPRPEADELVMVLNGFDTNFDRANELYAVNTIPFAHMHEPVRVRTGDLVRVHLVNVLEFDLINSFHVHGNFFNWYPTGTSRRPTELTDTVMLCQGQRGILELCFTDPGRFMFHAHQSEFTELGWMGFFEAEGPGGRPSLVCEVPS